jgi:predicted acyltransferase (DUF342 family)
MGDPYYENRIADLESKYELLRWIAEGQVAKLQAENAELKEALTPKDSMLWMEVAKKKDATISKLQAELKGTVTTEYHDKVVAEACRLVANVRAENNKLQAELQGPCGCIARQELDATIAENTQLDCALATKEMEAKEYCEIIDKIQAERDMYKAALERIYDNCSDTDLIIDIVDAALDTTEEVE